MTAARELEEHLATLGIRVVLKPFNVDHLISVVGEAIRTSRSTGTSLPIPTSEGEESR